MTEPQRQTLDDALDAIDWAAATLQDDINARRTLAQTVLDPAGMSDALVKLYLSHLIDAYPEPLVYLDERRQLLVAGLGQDTQTLDAALDAIAFVEAVIRQDGPARLALALATDDPFGVVDAVTGLWLGLLDDTQPDPLAYLDRLRRRLPDLIEDEPQ